MTIQCSNLKRIFTECGKITFEQIVLKLHTFGIVFLSDQIKDQWYEDKKAQRCKSVNEIVGLVGNGKGLLFHVWIRNCRNISINKIQNIVKYCLFVSTLQHNTHLTCIQGTRSLGNGENILPTYLAASTQ